jgi:hypothetical protein
MRPVIDNYMQEEAASLSFCSMIRKEVSELLRLGPMPSSEASTVESVRRYQDLLASIRKPVTDNEARELLKVFGDDELFGLAWTLLHLIESAPNWPLLECLSGSNPWIALMRRRVGNANQKQPKSDGPTRYC